MFLSFWVHHTHSPTYQRTTTLRMFSIFNLKERAADASGVKPKYISCFNPFQDADYSKALLQAATNWQVQFLADKAITSVSLVPSLLKTASNPLWY